MQEDSLKEQKIKCIMQGRNCLNIIQYYEKEINIYQHWSIKKSVNPSISKMSLSVHLKDCPEACQGFQMTDLKVMA